MDSLTFMPGDFLPVRHLSLPYALYGIFLCLFSLSTLLSALLPRLAPMRKLSPSHRLLPVLPRLRQCLTLAFLQKRNLSKIIGLAHILIFYGFLSLLPEIAEYFLWTVKPNFELSAVSGTAIAGIVRFSQDIFAATVLFAIAFALARRLLGKGKFINSFESFLILLMIAALMLTRFSVNLSLLNLNDAGIAILGEDYRWPVSRALFALFPPIPAESAAFVLLLSHASHILLVALFFHVIPRGKHLHILTSFFALYAANSKYRDKKFDSDENTPDLEQYAEALETEENPPFGYAEISDLGRKDWLDALTCTQCGRCSEKCPAASSGLSPMHVHVDLRKIIENKGKLNALLSERALKACTMCRACISECPLYLEHTNKILNIRRHRVASGNISADYNQVFVNLEKNKNPSGFPPKNRLRSAGHPSADADILIFVGCNAAFEHRDHIVNLCALLDKMQKKYTFANNEYCCGEPARVTGNEFLFQETAMHNIEQFRQANLSPDAVILTTCPHCSYVLDGAYADLGLEIPALHIMEWLARQDLEFDRIEKKIAWHNPCVSEHCRQINASSLLARIPGLTYAETPNHGCCGGGGGGYFASDESVIAQNRKKDLNALDAEEIWTSCPFCAKMLDGDKKAYHFIERIKDSI